MSTDFNPYRVWLRIECAHASPDYYQLLGIPRWENDGKRIRQAFEDRFHTLHKYTSGGHSEVAVRIVDELQQAYSCLSQLESKQVYDQQLRAGSGVSAPGDETPAGPLLQSDDASDLPKYTAEALARRDADRIATIPVPRRQSASLPPPFRGRFTAVSNPDEASGVESRVHAARHRVLRRRRFARSRKSIFEAALLCLLAIALGAVAAQHWFPNQPRVAGNSTEPLETVNLITSVPEHRSLAFTGRGHDEPKTTASSVSNALEIAPLPVELLDRPPIALEGPTAIESSRDESLLASNPDDPLSEPLKSKTISEEMIRDALSINIGDHTSPESLPAAWDPVAVAATRIANSTPKVVRKDPFARFGKPINDNRSLAWSADDTWLASGGPKSPSVAVWNVDDGTLRTLLRTGTVEEMASDADGRHLLCATKTHTTSYATTAIDPLGAVSLLSILGVGTPSVPGRARFSATGAAIGFATNDGIETHSIFGLKINTVSLPVSIKDFALSPNGERAAIRYTRSGNAGLAIVKLDADISRDFEAPHTDLPLPNRFRIRTPPYWCKDKSGRERIFAITDARVFVWRLPFAEEVPGELTPLEIPVGPGKSQRLCISPGGDQLAILRTGHIDVLDTDTGRIAIRLPSPAAIPSVAAFNPVVNEIAVGTKSGDVFIWDLTEAVCDVRLRQTPDVIAVAWSHNGLQLATAHVDQEIRLWHLPSRALEPGGDN